MMTSASRRAADRSAVAVRLLGSSNSLSVCVLLSVPQALQYCRHAMLCYAMLCYAMLTFGFFLLWLISATCASSRAYNSTGLPARAAAVAMDVPNELQRQMRGGTRQGCEASSHRLCIVVVHYIKYNTIQYNTHYTTFTTLCCAGSYPAPITVTRQGAGGGASDTLGGCAGGRKGSSTSILA
jgi:hypothetical protein